MMKVCFMFIKLKGYINMKIAIRKEPNGSIYIDKNLRDDIPYTEPPYNFIIVEVEKKDCKSSDFNEDLTFNIEKYNARKQKEIDVVKLAELTNWFDNYFDKQLNQSLWQDDFTVSHDNYFNKDYANIDELKAQAKIIRNEIRELRKVIEENA